MDLRSLNELFDASGRPKEGALPPSVASARRIKSELGDVFINEYLVDNKIVLVPDGSLSRAQGESYTKQSVGASLAVQARVGHLQADPEYHDKSVLIYTPNSKDAHLAATIAYANGIDAVVVDAGKPIRIGDLGAFGREFTARGGELRAGGRVTSIREDLGIGPPVSVVDVELQRGPGGVEARGSVMGAKDIGASAVTNIATEQVRGWLFDGNGTVGLGAFGPTAVVDAHGDGLVLVGGLVGVTLRVGGGPVTMFLSNVGVNTALQGGVGTANAWLNQLSPGDLTGQASEITTQLGDSWLSGTSLSEVGQGDRNAVEVAVAADLLRGIHELESLRQPVTAAPDRGGLGALYNNMQIDQKQAPLRAELEFWEQHLQSEGRAGLALAMASPAWRELQGDLANSLEVLDWLHSRYQQVADYSLEPDYSDNDLVQRLMSDRLKDIERFESHVVKVVRDQDSLLRAGDAAMRLVEPGVSWAESGLIRDWYTGMTVGDTPFDALASLALDVDGRMSDEFVERFDTPESRAAFDASYTGSDAGREHAYRESLNVRGAEALVSSGLTPRNFAEIRGLDVPGNSNAWAPGMPVAGAKGAVDAGSDAPQPNLEMDLSLDGSMPWPILEMDLSIDPAAIEPFTETGSLNPEYVLALRSPETFEAFLESDLNPRFAANTDTDQMLREVEAAYYLYLSKMAMDKNAAGAGLTAPPPDPPRSEWTAEQLARHGAISTNGEAVYSVYKFYQALRGGDTTDKVGAAIGLLQDLDRAGVSLGSLGDAVSGKVVGGVAAAIDLRDAIRSEDFAAAAQSVVQLATVANPGIVAANPALAYVGSMVRLADGDYGGAALDAMSAKLLAAGPYGWAAAAVLQLAGGELLAAPDPKATLSFRRGEDGNLVFETFSNRTGGELEDFLAAGAGAGVVDMMRGFEAVYGSVLVDSRIDVAALPALTLQAKAGSAAVEWRLEGGRNLEGGVQLLGPNPDQGEVARALRDTLLISHMQPHWRTGTGTFADPLTGELITQHFNVPGGGSAGERYVSRAVGTGVFAGGGNVGGNRGLSVLRDEDIRGLAPPPPRPVARQLAEVTRTWQVERGLFAGEGGQLLAVAAGAGLIGLDAVADQRDAPSIRSVFEHPHTVAVTGDEDVVIIAGQGVVARDGQRPVPVEAAADDDGHAPGVAANDGAQGDESEWMILHPETSEGAAVTNDAAHGPRVVPAAARLATPVAADVDPFAEARELAGIVRDLAATQAGVDEPARVDHAPADDANRAVTRHSSESAELAAEPMRPAIAVGFRGSMLEDRFLVTDVDRLLASEAEGTRLVDLGRARHGLVELRENGDIHFVPDPDYHGEAGFLYRIETADGGMLTRRSVVDVLPVNDRPVALDDVLHGVGGEPVALDALLLNDTDVDGDQLRLAAVGQVSHGAVTGSMASGFTYVPEPGFFGEARLVYVVEDSAGATAVARATLVIAEGENNAPEVAYAVVAEGMEESPVRLHQDDLLARVSDPEGDAVHIESIRAASGGQVHWDRGTGEIVFDPREDFHGVAELEFDVADAHGAVATGSAGIEIANVPDPIHAAPLELALAGGTATRIADSELLSAMTIDNPDGGAVEVVGVRMVDGEAGRVTRHEDGVIQWISAPGHVGPSAFEVRLSNGIERGVARVDVTVEEALPDAGYHDLLDELAAVAVAGEADPEPAPSSADAGDAAAAPDGEQGAGEEQDVAAVQDGGEARDTDTEPSYSGGQPGHDGEDESAEAGQTQVDPGVILSGPEDQQLTFTVADLLPDAGGAARIRGVVLDDPAHGQLRVDDDGGRVTFVPTADFFGTVGVDFRIDDDGASRDGRATLAIENVDDAPVVTDRDFKEPHFNFDEDEVAVFTPHELLGATTDVDGELLVLTGARLHDEALGEVSISDDGRLRLQPAADFHGDIGFDVDVTDGHSIVGATMTVRFWPVNDAPRPLDDHAATLEETELRVAGETLLVNDEDVDGPDGAGQGPRLVGVWAAAGGKAYFDAEADELVFRPEVDFFGEAWVDTVVEDAAGAWAVSRLHVSVANTHDPVVARDDVVHIDEDTHPFIPLTVLTDNDHNPDRGPLTLTALDTTGVVRGTLDIDDSGDAPGIRYSAEPDYHGTQFFTYTVVDETGHADSARVELVVDPVNDAPVVAPWHVAGTEDVPVVLHVDALNARADDVEGDWVRVSALSSDHGAIAFDPVTGAITFTPEPHLNSDLNGGPLELNYRVVDEGGASGEGIVHLDLAAVDDPPEAVDDTLLTWESGPGGYVNSIQAAWLLDNDIEHDGEALTLIGVGDAGVAGATVGFDADSERVTYAAAPGFVGEDTFTYTVADAAGGTDTATVSVRVLDNRAPVAYDFATVAAEDTILLFDAADFAAHVDDPDRELAGMPETLEVVAVGNAVNGSVALDADGRVVFQPSADYNSVQHGGVAGFDYVVEDIVGNRAGAAASIVYTPVNDAPAGVAEHLGAIDEDSAGLVFTGAQLLANDFDVDGDPLHIASIRATGGSVGLIGADTYRYVPARDHNGTGSIIYTVSDGELETSVVSTVTVRPVNDRPVVQFDHASGYDNGVRNTASGLLANDYDVDGDALHIAGITATSGNVQVTSYGGGAIHWQASSPGSGFVRYNVSDGNGGVTESRLDLSIAHKAIPPEFVSFNLDQSQGTYYNVTVHVQNGGRLRVVVDGSARATDADGPDSGIRYAGSNISVNRVNGDWNYETTLQLSANEAGPGNWVTRTVQFQAGMTATDIEGNFTTTSRSFRFDAHIQMNIASKPVVIDLDGDGLNLVGIDQSHARFDWDGDGIADRSGWIAGDGDALLVYDHDDDRRVTRADEISFVGYLEGAETDLEGLRAFDTDGDGYLSANDDEWAAFGLWRDDGDGVFDDGEFMDLDGAGISRLSLESDHNEVVVDGNVIHGEALFTRADGSTGTLGDVAFSYVRGGEDADGEHGLELPRETEFGAPHAWVEESAEEPEYPFAECTASRGESHSPQGEFPVPEPSATATDSPGSAANVDSGPVDDDIQLPSDEEFDRMARVDVERLARMPPTEPVAPLTDDAYVPGATGVDLTAIDPPDVIAA